MMQFLTRTNTLWILFALFVLETIGFGIVMAAWEFEIIDEMSDPELIRAHVEAMTQTQRTVHAWMTATLDVAYPLTYGALFTGLTLRAFRPIFALPAIAVIPTDLVEGVAQVLFLLGNDSLLWIKSFVTPLKLTLFFAALLIALIALGVDFKKRRQKEATG